MKRDSLNYFYIIALLYVIGVVFDGVAIYNHSKGYTKDKSGYVEILNFEDRLLPVAEWMFTGSGWDSKKSTSSERLKGSENHYATAVIFSYYFIASSAAFILMVLIIYWGGSNLFKSVGLSVITIALACLIIGIITPMLEIEAFSTNLTIPLKFSLPFIGEVDIPDKIFEGRMYYYY